MNNGSLISSVPVKKYDFFGSISRQNVLIGQKSSRRIVAKSTGGGWISGINYYVVKRTKSVR